MENPNAQCLIVLTVANEQQAALCKQLLTEYNISDSVQVVCDDTSGTPIGTGGSVLKIIETFYYKYKKIVIINSGGYSKRAFNYAIRGKAFISLNYKTRSKPLISYILENIAIISKKMHDGVLVCCSDILVDTSNIDIVLDHNTGFCIKTDFNTASHHGVMIPDSQYFLQDYEHKKTAEYLRKILPHKKGALTDLGMTFFDSKTVELLQKCCMENNLISIFQQQNLQLCLYEDIVKLLSKNVCLEEYLTSDTSALLKPLKSKLFDALSKSTMHVYELTNQHFFHFGTLSSILSCSFFLNDSKARNLFFNSSISKDCHVGNGTICDNVILSGKGLIGQHCIISDVVLHDAIIPNNTSIFGVRLFNGKYVTIVIPINENPKELQGGTSLWEVPRFYASESFQISFKKYQEKAKGEKISMKTCLKNADYSYFLILKRMIVNTKVPNNQYLMMRKHVIKQHFDYLKKPKTLSCLKDSIEIRLPVRINLAGTWTDAMPYCTDNGGEMINVCVKVDDKLPVCVDIEKLHDSHIELVSDNKITTYDSNQEEISDDFILHRTALLTLGINNDMFLNEGFRLSTYVHKLEKGSGLGVSSILLAGIFLAFRQMFGFSYTDNDIVNMVFVAEQIMQTGGGWQDQVGALFPGIKKSTSLPGIPQTVSWKLLPPGNKIKTVFSNRCIIIPTGINHSGSGILIDIMNRYIAHEPKCLQAFQDMLELTNEMEKSVLEDDTDNFFRLINLHHRLLQEFSPLVINQNINEIIEQISSSCSAVSICGAGGGGYLFAVLKENISLVSLQSLFQMKFPKIKSKILKIDLCISDEWTILE